MQSIRNTLTSTLQPGKCKTSSVFTQLKLAFTVHSYSAFIFSFYYSNHPVFFLFSCRVCVQVPLPAGQLLQMDCLLHDWTEPLAEGCFNQREALHVQSLSHWAPANIGPYSQALRVSLENIPKRETISSIYLLITVYISALLFTEIIGFQTIK